MFHIIEQMEGQANTDYKSLAQFRDVPLDKRSGEVSPVLEGSFKKNQKINVPVCCVRFPTKVQDFHQQNVPLQGNVPCERYIIMYGIITPHMH